MKTTFFFRGIVAMIIACLAAFVLGSCTTEDFPEGTTPTPPPTPQPGTFVELVSSNLLHGEWIVNSTLASDKAISQAYLQVTTDGITSKAIINENVPYTIQHEELPEMTRSKTEFTLLEVNSGAEQVIEESQNGNVKIQKIRKKTTFNYEGLSRTYTSTSTRVSYLSEDGIELANYVEDSIAPGIQESKIIERFEMNGEPYIRSMVTFIDDVYTTDTSTVFPNGDQMKRTITDQVIVTAPETPDPSKDYYEGCIEGEERLYKTGEFTYTAEKDVTEFWSVSGKKEKTYKVEYDVRQSIQDKQDFKIVPSYMIGNPMVSENVSASEPYKKAEYPDFEFVKTTTVWTYTWLNGFSIKITASSEKAWVIENGTRIKMPFSEHKYFFDKYTAGNATEKEYNRIEYLAYLHTLYFNGTYNNDPYDLQQVQEFYVEKGNDRPDTSDELVDTKIIKNFESVNGKHISTINFQQTWSKTGVRDSIVSQEIKQYNKIEEKKNFIRENNNLTLKETLDPVRISVKPRSENGHTVQTWTYQHKFDFDFFTSVVTEVYETAYTYYNGERVDFLTDKPSVVLSGLEPSDKGLIIGNDGKKYNRTNYVIKYKESYNNITTMLMPEVDIDVEDQTVPETDYIEDFKFSSKFDPETMTCTGTWWIKRHLSGETDSTSVVNVAKEILVHSNQHFYADNNTLTYQDVQNSKNSETAIVDGNKVTTTTQINKFAYNLFTGDVKVVYTSKIETEFAGKTLTYDIPDMPVINYAGMDGKDMGIVVGNDNVEYNRTNYTLKYKESWNGNAENHTAEVDIDVKKAAVVRTAWDVLNKKLEKYDDKHQKSSFILYEEFSDGSKKNTAVEVLLNVYGSSPAKQTVKRSHANLQNGNVSAGKETTSTRTEGDFITVTTHNVAYTQTYEPELTAVYPFVHETAVYKNGDVEVEFLTSSFNVSDGGFANPYGSEITEGADKYDRYNCTLRLNATYNNISYNQSAAIDVDVKKENPTVTRTFWEARDKGLEYVSQRQHRSYFTLYEEFSDGTKKNTTIETYLNIYGEGPAKRIVDMSGAEFNFVSVNPGTPQNGTRTDGEHIFINSVITPYNAVYQNEKGEKLTNVHTYASETATYRNGEIVVEFPTSTWSITENGHAAPLQGVVTKGYDEYNRYNGAFNLNGVYNNHDYPTTAEVDVDVVIVHDSNIDWTKTQMYGGTSYTWDVVNNKLVPVITHSFIVKDGVINVTNGIAEFTPMDISRINSRVSAVLNAGNGNNTKYTASTLEVIKNGVNPYWHYDGYDGISIANVNGVDILKIDGVDINKPFIQTPTSGDVYSYSNGRLTITYNGQVVYSGYGEI